MLLDFFYLLLFCLLLTLIWHSAFSKRGYIVHPNRKSYVVYIKISTYLFDTSQIPLHFSRYSKNTKNDQWKRKKTLKSRFELKEHFGYTLVISYKSLLAILYTLALLNRQTLSESTGERWNLHGYVTLLDFFSEN